MRDDLILNNLDYVKKIYETKFRYYDYLKDDMISAGYYGLIKASNSYDESKNIKFTTHAYLYIKGEMHKVLQHQLRYNDLIAPAELEHDEYEDHKYVYLDELSALNQALNQLKEKDRKIIEELYFKGKSLRQLGAEMKVIYQNIQQKRNRILKKLKEIMKNE